MIDNFRQMLAGTEIEHDLSCALIVCVFINNIFKDLQRRWYIRWGSLMAMNFRMYF